MQTASHKEKTVTADGEGAVATKQQKGRGAALMQAVLSSAIPAIPTAKASAKINFSTTAAPIAARDWSDTIVVLFKTQISTI